MKYCFFSFFLLVTNLSLGQQIEVDGDWEKELDISDIHGIGNDYSASYISDEDASEISVSSYPPNNQEDLYGNFKIFVQKEDEDWHPNLTIQVRRTSIGSNNNNNIYSGTEFQSISNSPSFFFESIGMQLNVPIQYKIIGLSVLIPAGDYSAEIIFTVLN